MQADDQATFKTSATQDFGAWRGGAPLLDEALRVEISHLTELTLPHLKAFDLDLDPELGLACLTADGDAFAVYLNGRLTRSWRKEGHWKPAKIKWFGRAEVVIYPDLSIISADSWRELEQTWPYVFTLSDSYMFIGYDEEAIQRALINDPERHLVSIRTRDGGFEFGFEEIFLEDRDAEFDEPQAAYSFGDCFAFIIYSSDRLWLLDTKTRTYRSIAAPFSLASIHVMSGDDKKTYANFDNRPHVQGHPDLPPFELAVFDLVARTAKKRTFAPVAAALVLAGFDPAMVTLQPNAKGRIIVSDDQKAALLEFCDGD
ncbi:hypothetical protein [Methylocapsa palsarum]|uniref:Uncharacterized protein n=1 Tax=Methylocapsa palsarum TaxID=1612308 RepID=A0A1I3YK00_9HYPH|nr:hypothetical protein [Methylocapsa palsarum]SFK32110.1 hypothetical protein SAMN05444581_1063 [Methylocapsa palsarum]